MHTSSTRPDLQPLRLSSLFSFECGLCLCFGCESHLPWPSQTINSLLGELPVELRSGWIEHAWVTVPLKNITTSLVDNCKLELEGLRLTFAPRKVKSTPSKLLCASALEELLIHLHVVCVLMA
jgi:hypothetical protein